MQSKRSLFSNLESHSTLLGMEHKSLPCSFKLIHGNRLVKRQKVSEGDADQWFGEFSFWPITKDQKGKGHTLSGEGVSTRKDELNHSPCRV